MSDLFATAAFILLLIGLYAVRAPILRRLRRFEAQNVERRLAEQNDRRDQLAHYRHTLKLAEEQVDEIAHHTEPDSRTGYPIDVFTFAGERFASRDEAEAARNAAIVAKARQFYRELPAALAARGNGKLGRD